MLKNVIKLILLPICLIGINLYAADSRMKSDPAGHATHAHAIRTPDIVNIIPIPSIEGPIKSEQVHCKCELIGPNTTVIGNVYFEDQDDIISAIQQSSASCVNRWLSSSDKKLPCPCLNAVVGVHKMLQDNHSARFTMEGQMSNTKVKRVKQIVWAQPENLIRNDSRRFKFSVTCNVLLPK